MKYKIFKFENDLGETWYQIKARTGWVFYYWIREFYDWPDHICDPKQFNTEEECLTYIEREKEDLRQQNLRKQIKITEVKYDI